MTAIGSRVAFDMLVFTKESRAVRDLDLLYLQQDKLCVRGQLASNGLTNSMMELTCFDIK